MDYFDEQRALLEERRLERRRRKLEHLIARAHKRLLRRKARAEAYWTLCVHKTGRNPTPRHSTYERAYALETEAHILLNHLSRVLTQHHQ